MKLTKKDKEYLSTLGCLEKDFDQIEKACSKTVYTTSDNQRLSQKETINRLGRNVYLSGIARSAFHWDASRSDKDGNSISFDSSKLFK